jgi:tRNA dimethylallyltransferase
VPKLRYIILAGPTGVGKTDLAIQIAQGLHTEIIGGDAFQIYQGLNILTGKPAEWQLAAVRHHLVGILPLTELSDAHQYATLARQTVAALNQNGLIPLVVGGTGFYLQALESGIPELPPVDSALRAGLNQRSTDDLLRELEIRDPAAYGRIDRHNRRRIVRALEVCIASGKSFSSFQQEKICNPAIAAIVLQRPRPELVQRIDQRIDDMFEHGVVAEVAAVEEIGETASKAIGFPLIRALVDGAIDIPTCKQAIKQQTRGYAKRQMTWFRRQPYEQVDAETSSDYLVATLRGRIEESGSG